MNWRCGHDRTPENTVRDGAKGKRVRCRQCNLERSRNARAEIAPRDRYIDHRRRYLPKALEDAKLKVAHLEIEAKRIGLGHLVEMHR